MQTLKMAISPAMASEWLATKNTRNRRLSTERASVYADDMRNGNWKETHQGIAFYSDGVIADGQTRLKAIEISKCTVEMLVTFGVSDCAAIGIDAHRMRATHDSIAISQQANWLGKNEIAVAKLLLSFSKGKTKLSTQDLVAFCDTHKEKIVFACSSLSTAARYISTAAIRCAIALAHPYEDTKRLQDFCRTLSNGVMESPRDLAAIRLRERLLLDGGNFMGSETKRKECLMLSSRAIKAFCDGEQIKKLQMPKDAIYVLL